MADTLDLLTLAEAKDILEIGSTDHDTELAGVITGVSRRIDSLCGPVVQRTVSDELHDGGVHAVRLDKTYAASASSVTEYVYTTATVLTAETNAAKSGDDYLLDDVGRGVVLLRRRASGTDAKFADGRRNVEVTYTAGRVADTASVDELFKRAAGFMVTHLWKSTGPAWHTDSDFFDQSAAPLGVAVPTFGVPRIVMEMLHDELQIPAVV